MKISVAEIADKYTILLLKQEAGLIVHEDVQEYEKALQGVDWQELYAINQQMWDHEEIISTTTDLNSIGEHYLALRSLTLKRVAAKNKIAVQYGEHLEVKGY